MKNQIYGEFAHHYDLLGWNRFAGICALRLANFVKLRGTGRESVLDLACGTGELEYRLRRTAMSFVGVDISHQMLKEARRKNPGGRFVHGDIASVRLNRKFDIVTCFFDSLNHLSGLTEIKKAFKTTRLHLRDGGFFIFDMLTESGLAGWESVEIRRGPEFYVTVNGHHDAEKARAEVKIEGFVLAAKGRYRRFKQTVAEQAYPFEVISDSLSGAGFKKIAVSSFNSDEPIEKTSRWFFVVS